MKLLKNNLKKLYSEEMKKAIQFICFLLISLLSFGQIGLGQWREHYNFNNGKKIIYAKDDVYMQSDLGLLKYNTKTKELEKVTRITGLNDSHISDIEFSEETNSLIVGYTNGNIDIISNNEIINIIDIKRKQIIAEKSINSIATSGNFAYLGCGFGIVVLDIVRQEIKDTWYIGNNGSYVKTNKILVHNSTIYAATETGVYKGDMNQHLADFANWEIITNNNYGDPNFDWLHNKSIGCLAYFKDKLIVSCRVNDNQDSLLVYDGNSWDRLHIIVDFRFVFDISCTENRLIFSFWISGGWGEVTIFNENFNKIRNIYNLVIDGKEKGIKPKSAKINLKDTTMICIADESLGLIVYNLQWWSHEKLNINCPTTNDVYDMTTFGNNVYSVAGSVNLSWGQKFTAASFYTFINQNWVSYDRTNVPEFTSIYDFVSIAVDPFDENRIFLGSWYNGLFEFRNNSFYRNYTDQNSTIRTVTNSEQIRVNGLVFDKNGNLWLTNSLTEPAFHILTRDNNWHSLHYQNFSENISKMIITKNNTKWVIISRGYGLFAFNDNETIDDQTDDKYKKFLIYNEIGETLSNDIYSIAEDQDGYIWIGTAQGIVVYYNPEDIFKSNIAARQIKVPRNNGTNEADLLLESETVTAIAVDGANKKWFGTRTSGVYYTSSDGLEEIFHFTAENSPLPDNNISSIAIAENSGEVFIGTNSGLISFRNVPTEPKQEYSDVYTFPNPVTEDYDGPIAITGLTTNSFVKITDIAGNLVYETKSEGGQAVWNGKNARGTRVKTGIYLVFSVSEDGSQKVVTKILFIN
ncbi:MAG: hypothetical protein LBV69_08920 [Bacteroidales bacterium]|jgi:hypothetical protein|nr:hypothetical protein [Bacteroidales bacterium]